MCAAVSKTDTLRPASVGRSPKLPLAGSSRGSANVDSFIPWPQRPRPAACPLVGGARLLASRDGPRVCGASSRPATTQAACSAAYPSAAEEWISWKEGSPQRSLGFDRSSTVPPTSRPRVAQPSSVTVVAVGAPSTTDGGGLESWLERGKEIEELAASLAQPSTLLTGVVLDALRRVTPAQGPHRSLLQGLLAHVETAIYCQNEEHSLASWLRQPPQVAEEQLPAIRAIPPCYQGCVPYFTVARRQRARARELQKGMQHLQIMIQRAEKLQIMQVQKTVSSFAGRTPWSTGLAQAAMDSAQLLILFGFWKVFHLFSEWNDRKKAGVLALKIIDDLILPFKHWYIFLLEQWTAASFVARQSFLVENQMLGVTVKSLEQDGEEIEGELQLSDLGAQRLEAQLQEAIRKREALTTRLVEARSELVKSTLCLVLNFVFAEALKEAKLYRVIARQLLGTCDLSALLLASEEDNLSRLSTMQSEALLIRWINYHLMQSKRLATKVSHTSGEGPEFSTRDAEMYNDRFRVVRGLQRIVNLNEELQDGVVLSVLYASLTFEGKSESTLNLAALWPLDERDTEARAVKLCNAFRMILPTRAAQCLLGSTDITRGNTPAMTILLASLFLHRSRLPSLVAETRILDYIGISTGDVGTKAEGKTTQHNVELDVVVKPHGGSQTATQASGLPIKQVVSVMESAASTCAYDSLQELQQLLRESENPGDLARLPCDELLLRWVNYKLEGKNIPRVTHMGAMKCGHILWELLRVVADDLISVMPEARLINESKGVVTETMIVQVVVACSSRCTSFPILTQEALREGQDDVLAAFLASLFLCRPSLQITPTSQLRKHVEHIGATVRGGGILGGQHNEGSQTSEFTELCIWLQDNKPKFDAAMDAVAAARQLHQEVERHMFCFLADLLARRALGAPSMANGGAELVEKSEDDSQCSPFLPLDRIKEILAHELARPDEDALEGHGKRNALSFEAALRAADGQERNVADLLRKNAALFKEMFRHYAESEIYSAKSHGHAHGPRGSSNHKSEFNAPHHGSHASHAVLRNASTTQADSKTLSVDLRKLTRMHKDCRMRCLNFTPADVEEIYLETTAYQEAERGRNASINGVKLPADSTAPATSGLVQEGFVEALLIMACRGQLDGPIRGSLPAQFAYVIERHLWPFATHRKPDMLYAMTYNPEIELVLKKHERVLWAVFQRYAQLGQQMEVQAKTVRTKGKRLSSVSKNIPGGKKRLRQTQQGLAMEVTGFETMLQHADLLLGRKLTVENARSIVGGIQHVTPVDAETDDESGGEKEKEPKVPDQSSVSGHLPNGEYLPLSFQEFIDALIAVTFYMDRNPFVPFMRRFNRLVTFELLVPLKQYWVQKDPLADICRILSDALQEQEALFNWLG